VCRFWQKILIIKSSFLRAMVLYIWPQINILFNISLRKRLLQYKNCLHGKRVWIIATGPSLLKDDVDRLKAQGEVLIAVNSAIDLVVDYEKSFYLNSDKIVLDKFSDTIRKYSGTFFTDIYVRKLCSNLMLSPIYYCGYLKHSWKKLNCYTREDMHVAGDVARKGINLNGIMVVTHAIEMAFFMGAKEIVLIGCDCGRSANGKYHFNTDSLPEYESIERENQDFNVFFEWVEVAKDYASKKGVRFMNATRGGRLEKLERISFDDIIGQYEE